MKEKITLLSLGLLFYLINCCCGAKVETLVRFSLNDSIETLDTVLYRPSALDSKVVLAGSKKSGSTRSVWALWGEWSESTGLKNNVAREFVFDNLKNCQDPILGASETPQYLSFSCQDTTSNDAKIVIARLDTNGDSILSHGIVSYPNAKQDADVSLGITYLEARVMFTVRNNKDSDVLYFLDKSFNTQYSLEADVLGSLHVIGRPDVNNFWVMSTPSGNLYVSHFIDGNVQESLTMSFDKASFQSAAVSNDILMICFEEIDSSEDIKWRSIMFMGLSDLSKKAHRRITNTQKGNLQCSASSDGRRFIATIENYAQSYATWVFNSEYNLEQSFSLTHRDGYHFAARDIDCTDNTCRYLLSAGVTGKQSDGSDSEGAFAAIDLSETGSDMTALGGVTTQDLPNVANLTVKWTKATLVSGFTVSQSEASIVKNFDITLTSMPLNESNSANTLLTLTLTYLVYIFAF